MYPKDDRPNHFPALVEDAHRMAFPEYHKIQGLYKRDDKGNFILGNYSLDEFKYLEDDPWYWTEKVDGTNIRIGIDPKVQPIEETASSTDGIMHGSYTEEPEVRIGGHHNNSQLHATLVQHLQDTFVNADNFDRIQTTLTDPVVLYGEGYGGKIQSGVSIYGYPESPAFILFDVWVQDHRNPLGGYWLDRTKVCEIADGLAIPVVPLAVVNGSVIGLATLRQAVYDVRYNGVVSHCGRSGAAAEGIVGTPKVQLFNRRGHRIITKIKARDFDYLKRDTDPHIGLQPGWLDAGRVI